jgi:hypothetical protein
VEDASPKLRGRSDAAVRRRVPGRPHLGYKRWRASQWGTAVLRARLEAALAVPWLIAVAGALLAVSLVASPIAFAAERRRWARERG